MAPGTRGLEGPSPLAAPRGGHRHRAVGGPVNRGEKRAGLGQTGFAQACTPARKKSLMSFSAVRVIRVFSTVESKARQHGKVSASTTLARFRQHEGFVFEKR